MSVYIYRVERRDPTGDWHGVGDPHVVDLPERRPTRAARSLAHRLALQPTNLAGPVRVSVWSGYVVDPLPEPAAAYTVHPASRPSHCPTDHVPDAGLAVLDAAG